MTQIRGLYPVEFSRPPGGMENNMYASKEPWPLEFTREGLEAEFLWLGDTATAGAVRPGPVFPASTVIVRCAGRNRGPRCSPASPTRATAQNGRQPAYFAGQFYGSGRVFYLGSGEMWRLRTRR